MSQQQLVLFMICQTLNEDLAARLRCVVRGQCWAGAATGRVFHNHGLSWTCLKTCLKPVGVGDESTGTAHFDIIKPRLPHNTLLL